METLFDFAFRGLNFRLAAEHDDCHGSPWKEEDGHGPIRETNSREDKRAGERMIMAGRGFHGYAYDIAEATRIAKRDGWGVSDEVRATMREDLGRDPTAGEVVARAVEIDFQRMRAWLNDEWEYQTLRVALLDVDGDEVDGACEYLGGVNSDCGDAWHLELAHDMAAQIIDAHDLKRRKYLQQGATRTQVRA